MSRVARFIFWLLLSVVALSLVFVAVSVIPLDRRPYTERRSYWKTREAIESLDIPLSEGRPLGAGFSVVNITPDHPVSMAGSGLRKLRADSVADSLFVRTLVVGADSDVVAMVSVDMLIFPPALTRLVYERLPEIGLTADDVYLGATHTHSGIGNWGEHLAGRLYSGPYNETMMANIAEKIVTGIVEARKGMKGASFKHGAIPVPGLAYNRLSDEGDVDSLLRVIEIKRDDSTKLLFASFTGHATCDRADSKAISRDYPGVFVDGVERNGYTFAMFMAGAVGSHSCRGPASGRQKIEYVGDSLVTTFLQGREILEPLNDSLLLKVDVPLFLPEPQVKISRDWRVRPWLYRTLFGRYSSELKFMCIGDVVLVGTPCDFSGELSLQVDNVASSLGLKTIVTSFNGSYIGYITVDERYDDDHYETRLMNWYGPWNGAYLTESIGRVLERIAQDD